MAEYDVSSLKPNKITPILRSNTFALKWPEENNKSASPPFIAVNLSIDSNGFYLICLNKSSKEVECFDIALIHDTRTGDESILPRGANENAQVYLGDPNIPLYLKCLTIYYGNSFIPDRDLRIIHFCFHSPAEAREWQEQLFLYSRNPSLRNPSGLNCLEKIHTKLIHTLIGDRSDGKPILVRSLIQFLCKNKRDPNKETKILKTLELLELPCRTEAVLDPDQFTFNKFVGFYMQLMERHEIDKLFESASEIDVDEGVFAIVPGAKHRRYLSCEKIQDFIRKQNDGHDGALGNDDYRKKAEDLLRKYTQHDKKFLQKGMSDESFLRYLLSFDNHIVDPSKFDLYMDMDKPLAHYFISSSHNTYLTGSQLKGRASVEMYRQVLLTGCRCIELDVVDSEKKNDEPEIKHRNTPVRSIPFVQVIRAIRETAFKVSPYPVILSLENHCNPKAQARMAEYLVDILGDYLVTQPLKTHPCEENCPLPSPSDLKYKILIKNKKLHQSPTNNVNNVSGLTGIRKTDSIQMTNNDQSNVTACNSISASTNQSSSSSLLTNESISQKQLNSNEIRDNSQPNEFDQQNPSETNRKTILIEDLTSSTDDEDSVNPVNETNPGEIQSADPTSSDENRQTQSRATKAMSDLVHYVVPVRFVDFARAEERKRSYEISSFGEERAQNLIRDYGREFVAYNRRQLSRIYPRGTRFDSSNYNPYTFWPVGCQLVALNYQTLDTPMQVNLGFFSYNGACGYIKKPASLCHSTGSFDPNCRNSVENVVVYQIEIKIISGQFLCQDREPTYVDVEMYGVYADATRRHEYRSRAKRWNGFQAVYDESDVGVGECSIRFSKVILPEMASLRFAVSEEDGSFVGQCLIPVVHLRSGYRHIVLRNQMNVAVSPSTLFVFIRKNVHVDEEDQILIEGLVSPKPMNSNVVEPLKRCPSKHLSSQRSRSIGDLDPIREGRPVKSGSTTDEPICPPMRELNDPAGRRPRIMSSAFVDENPFLQHLIVSSQLNKENFPSVDSIDEFESSKDYRRKSDKIQTKMRKRTAEIDKKIEIEEEKFEHCLARREAGSISPLKRRVIRSETTNTDGRTTSFTLENDFQEELKQIENQLLDLHSEKIQIENKIENKYSNRFYNELDKEVTKFFDKRLNKIDSILKLEKSKVTEEVRVQMENETKRKIKAERNPEKISDLKEKIRQSKIEAAVLAIRKLTEKHEDLSKQIRNNADSMKDVIRRGKETETKIRFQKFSSRLDEVKEKLSTLKTNQTRRSPSTINPRSNQRNSLTNFPLAEFERKTNVEQFCPSKNRNEPRFSNDDSDSSDSTVESTRL